MAPQPPTSMTTIRNYESSFYLLDRLDDSGEDSRKFSKAFSNRSLEPGALGEVLESSLEPSFESSHVSEKPRGGGSKCLSRNRKLDSLSLVYNF